MHVKVNGTQLWFDVDGLAWVPDGATLRERPTVIVVHGGPGTYDHSYFKPHFTRLTAVAQVVYIDLRGHGRSARGNAAEWSFERCADDLRAFCDTVGISKPIVYGHSMGGIVAMIYGARHQGRAAGLVLQSTMARFDLARLVRGFRRFGGDEVAELAERDYGGGCVTEAEWARVFAAFGPRVPGAEELARRIGNLELARCGMRLLRRLDSVDQLARIKCPTLICVGALDPVTPLEAAREIFDATTAGIAQFEVIDRAGHFPWLDTPDEYWKIVDTFVTFAGASAISANTRR